MKKFSFPLRSVAIQRNLRESERSQEFSAAVRTHAMATIELANVVGRIATLSDTIAAGRAGRFRPADQAVFLQDLANERVREAAARKKQGESQVAMEEARLRWVEARRDVRLIETLETKARTAHRQAGEREEQAALDDRVNALFARADGISP